jgi:hypothetical protein
MSIMHKIYSIITIIFIFLPAFSAVSAQNRKAVGGAEVTGTFRARGGNEFKIQALGKGWLRVAFTGIYKYDTADGKMANTGIADGEALIEGDTAIFKLEDFEECKITMKFLTGGKLRVSQEGSCGFGFNVSADGTYRKISGAKPKF